MTRIATRLTFAPMRNVLTILLLAGTAGAASAADWEYALGIHDFNVPDVDSHTYGVIGRVSVQKQTKSGRHLVGSADVYADHDKDELDPDHIPIRWDVHLGTDGEFWQGGQSHVGWTAEVDTRMNTVSSVEREITAMPAIVARYDGQVFQPSLKAGAGWFFLEIDDDVPKTRGYTRDDFRNSTFAATLAAEFQIKAGACCTIVGQAQHWQDADDWLQTRFSAVLHINSGDWLKGGEMMLSADYYEYNLDVYQLPGSPPILPWDDDLLVRLLYTIRMR